MANVKEILKNAVVLFLITAVVSALLAGANLLTKDKIAQNSALAEQKALAEVIEVESFEVADQIALYELQEPITGAYFAKNGNEIVGCCVKVEPSGYGGAMELIFGVDTNLAITGVSVLSHGETAGLGANMTKEEFRNQFVGKKEIAGVVKSGAKENEIQALSGATISSKAMANGAKTALIVANSLLTEKGAVKE